MRTTLLALVVVGAVSLAWSATPTTGSLATAGASVSWSGGPMTGAFPDAANDAAGDPLPAFCGTLSTCDTFSLVVGVPSTFYTAYPTYGVQISVNWASDTNDFDVYLYDANGNLMYSSAQQLTNSEFIDAGRLAAGTYQVLVISAATVDASYTASASLVAEPSVPSGRARYTAGKFTFNTPQELNRPADVQNILGSTTGNPLLYFALDQDVEPRVVHDALGNLYAAAIEGVPGGVDIWKSMNGGKSWSYLGQPDGAQALATFGLTGMGVGGGDEDLAMGSSGTVYMDSLWLGSVTQTVSNDGGNTWIDNPAASNLPGDDRQWLASYGANTVYETYKQVGVLLNGTSSIWVGKSTDGGITFPQLTEVTTPELGVQPGVQGNITVDANNGYVYTVFAGADGSEIYIARSTDGGQTWIIKLAYQGAAGVSLQNVFPTLAVDRGSNLHVAFSDGKNVYLTSSATQGATWTPPVRVNNGSLSKSAVGPWVDAAAPGKVNVFWWGTSHTNFMDVTSPWQVFMAQSQNAFANVPTFAQAAATGIMHVGAICVNGLACSGGSRNMAEYFAPDTYLDGNALIVYPDDKNSGTATGAARTWFVRQVGGPVIR